eukprot:CAMPEP_0183709086 /NCGR_PEP_ID=MMETSP0737-20130205/5212_1 /TAXON_ID=385413 /ORGANISM="Thalassiosira miniscula, Strain CCMP1093" /LENGTH=35 /DNA_ID= /DNA_START= /DNA_END= /DNA_ORIENTATION=
MGRPGKSGNVLESIDVVVTVFHGRWERTRALKSNA